IAEDPLNNSRFLDGKSCFLAAYPLLRYEGKIPVGYGTGLISSYRGGTQVWKYFLRSQLYIPTHLYRIKDIEKRNFQLAKEIIGKDFRQFSGVPSIVTNTLEKLLENASKLGIQARKVADLFPEYHFSYFGGLSPKFYEKKLTALIGHKLDYREQLSATEGILGIQLQQEPGFTPMVNANFFEFIPVKNPADRCIINEIRKNEEYFICISSHNGLYAYNMGDIIKFVSEDPPRFVFSSREGVVNLVDEKISQQDILYAIEHTSQTFKTVLTDFAVVALRTPYNHYLFMIEFASKNEPATHSDYLKALDTYLQEANEVYRYFRRDIGILKSPTLWILNPGTFERIVNERAGRGLPREQTKIPHLSDKAALMREFEGHIKLQIEL
ncbi:MAG: GH3 auxin-responsive promoter family protein, partial [Candidatus Helarchaeota archaeon]|nr:GH3 auxin-responsive promoter family protein [Candidatus Helarchaeota archaeon]